MKTLPTDLTTALAGGATTLCKCWRIERRDGVVLGFTDHDRQLMFDGVTHTPAAGLSASNAETALGLAVGDMSVVGILSDESLTENDLVKGLFDGAKVLVYWVDWSNPETHVLVRSALIGEVARGENGFVAELRSFAEYLSHTYGRRFTFGCDADLGDGRCGVDLTSPSVRATGQVSDAPGDNRYFLASGLSAFETQFFSRGQIEWTSGANTGLAGEVKRHDVAAGLVSIELWALPAGAIALGDEFIITAGCDKQFATCKAKFFNTANFRGFPYMPGNDWVMTYPTDQDVMDGGSRYND